MPPYAHVPYGYGGPQKAVLLPRQRRERSEAFRGICVVKKGIVLAGVLFLSYTGHGAFFPRASASFAHPRKKRKEWGAQTDL